MNPTDLFVLDPPKRSEGRRAHAHRVPPALLGVATHRHSRGARAEREREAAQAAAGSRGQRQGQARRTNHSKTGLSGDTRTVTPTIFFGIFWALIALGVVVGVPPLASPGHVVHGRAAVPRRAVRVLCTSSNARSRPDSDPWRSIAQPSSRPRPASSRSSFAHRYCAAMRSTSGSARRCSSRPSTARRWARSSTAARPTRCSRCATTRPARCRRALVGQSRRRARARGIDARASPRTSSCPRTRAT